MTIWLALGCVVSSPGWSMAHFPLLFIEMQDKRLEANLASFSRVLATRMRARIINNRRNPHPCPLIEILQLDCAREARNASVCQFTTFSSVLVYEYDERPPVYWISVRQRQLEISKFYLLLFFHYTSVLFSLLWVFFPFYFSAPNLLLDFSLILHSSLGYLVLITFVSFKWILRIREKFITHLFLKNNKRLLNLNLNLLKNILQLSKNCFSFILKSSPYIKHSNK